MEPQPFAKRIVPENGMGFTSSAFRLFWVVPLNGRQLVLKTGVFLTKGRGSIPPPSVSFLTGWSNGKIPACNPGDAGSIPAPVFQLPRLSLFV